MLRRRASGVSGAARRAPGRRAAADRPHAHLRPLRDRARQPPRPRGGARRRRASRRGLQPALPPRPAGARQDPPAGRDRRVPARDNHPELDRPLHHRRALHQRVRRRPAQRRARALQGALPRARRAADRRRPGPRGQAAHRGGVRPHLQRPVRSRQADRALQRPAAGGARAARASACATASSGASPSSSSRPTCGPGSRCCGASPATPATELPDPDVAARDRDPGARQRPPPRGRDDPRGRGRLGPRRAARRRRWSRRALRPRPSRRASERHRSRAPSVAAIQEAVSSVLGVPREELLSTRRTPRVARARQLAMYLTRELTSLSLAQIAREFDRDHSTVLHAITRRRPATRAGVRDRERHPQRPRSAGEARAAPDPPTTPPPTPTHRVHRLDPQLVPASRLAKPIACPQPSTPQIHLIQVGR